MKPFHAQLREALERPGVVIIADRLYCTPGRNPLERWHVQGVEDTPGFYRWDGPCPDPSTCTATHRSPTHA